MSSYITRHQLYNNVINISQTPLQTAIKATRIPSLFTALCYLRLEMEQPNIKHTLSSVAKKPVTIVSGNFKAKSTQTNGSIFSGNQIQSEWLRYSLCYYIALIVFKHRDNTGRGFFSLSSVLTSLPD